jgi:hypothetical protein
MLALKSDNHFLEDLRKVDFVYVGKTKYRLS